MTRISFGMDRIGERLGRIKEVIERSGYKLVEIENILYTAATDTLSVTISYVPGDGKGGRVCDVIYETRKGVIL